MIEISGNSLKLVGVVNNDRSGALLEEGEAGMLRVAVIDLAGVTEADSSLLALLLAWVRSAGAVGRKVEIRNASHGLRNLAELYGVREFLPFAA